MLPGLTQSIEERESKRRRRFGPRPHGAVFECPSLSSSPAVSSTSTSEVWTPGSESDWTLPLPRRVQKEIDFDTLLQDFSKFREKDEESVGSH